MIKHIFTIAAVFIFSSCATLIHQRTTNIQVYSDIDSVRICNNRDTTKWFNTPTTICVERSRNDLIILAKKDSLYKMFRISSRLSTAFWLGNIFSGIGIIGYGIDLTNPKRYTYPRNVTLSLNSTNNTGTSYKTSLTPEKGLLSLKLSIPEGNQLYLNKGHGYGNTFGFLGISGGFEYYFTDKYCLNMDVGALTDFSLPFPAPVDYGGNYERSFATYGDFQIGSDFKRFHYDVGIQFNRTSHYERETIDLYPDYIDILKYSKNQNNIGLALSSYYRISNGFNLGLNYYPSFFSWDNSIIQTHYSHMIFLELNF